MRFLFELIPAVLVIIAIIQSIRIVMLPYDRRRNNKLAFSVGIFSCLILLISQGALLIDMLVGISIVTEETAALLWIVFKSSALMTLILFAESALPIIIKHNISND